MRKVTELLNGLVSDDPFLNKMICRDLLSNM
jgi:hypothetical protein